MQTVIARWVLLFSLLLSSVCALAHAADQTITRTVEHFTLVLRFTNSAMVFRLEVLLK